MSYDTTKWGTEFPTQVNGTNRPTDALSNASVFDTNDLPQYISADPVRYSNLNLFFTQLLSNDQRLQDEFNNNIGNFDLNLGPITDCNFATTMGIGHVSSTTLNLPSSFNSSSAIICIFIDSFNNTLQYIKDPISGNIFNRKCTNSTWNMWTWLIFSNSLSPLDNSNLGTPIISSDDVANNDGTATNAVISGGKLILSSTSNVYASSGSYVSKIFDMGSVAKYNVQTVISASVSNTQYYSIQFRTSNDNVTWESYHSYQDGQYTFRYMQFNMILNTTNTASSPSISKLLHNFYSVNTLQSYMPISSVSSYDNIDYLFNPNKIFGSTFDGVNSTGTRTDNSVGLSFSPSSDIVEGTDDFRDFDPFNVIEVLTKPNSNGGSDIIAYQGDGLFDKYKDDDEFGADVLVGFPKGYMYNYIDSNNIITKKVSSSYQDGYIASPMHLRNSKLHNYVYLTKYGWCNDGNGGICSRPGHPQKVNTMESQFETLSRAKGFRVMGINEVSWLQHLGCIKYNSLNWQNTIGQGVSATYVDKIATVTETGVTRIILSNTDAASFAVGNYVLLSLNTSLNYAISSITTYDTNNMAINLNTTTTFNTTASSTHIYMAPAYSGGCDTILGQDGEISTGISTKRSVLTFNLENLYSNTWKILSGIVLPDNSTVYLNPNPDDNYTWPSSATDAVNRGWTKYNISIPQVNGYINTFGYDPTYPYLSIPATVGGPASYNNPVGDYFYTTTFTSPHCAILGGDLSNGASDGPFCLSLSNGVTFSGWHYGAFGVYIPDM